MRQKNKTEKADRKTENPDRDQTGNRKFRQKKRS